MLRELREKAELTHRTLAKRLGREHSFVYRVEHGERRLDLVEFYWYCKALGVDPESVARRVMKDCASLDRAGAKHR
jgi:transcriptional regulator with XRE-family HTH domain